MYITPNLCNAVTSKYLSFEIKQNEKQITELFILDPIFDVYLILNLGRKKETCGNNFYLSRILNVLMLILFAKLNFYQSTLYNYSKSMPVCMFEL